MEGTSSANLFTNAVRPAEKSRTLTDEGNVPTKPRTLCSKRAIYSTNVTYEITELPSYGVTLLHEYEVVDRAELVAAVYWH